MSSSEREDASDAAHPIPARDYGPRSTKYNSFPPGRPKRANECGIPAALGPKPRARHTPRPFPFAAFAIFAFNLFSAYSFPPAQSPNSVFPQRLCVISAPPRTSYRRSSAGASGTVKRMPLRSRATPVAAFRRAKAFM